MCENSSAMGRRIFMAAAVAGALAFLTMLAATAVWMTVPIRIVYHESSTVRTEANSVEVRQHGTSFFVTPAQKKTLDRIDRDTPRLWFGSLGIVVVAILVGAAVLSRRGRASSGSVGDVRW